MNKTPSRRPNGLYSAEVNSAKFGENYSSYLVRNEIEFLVFLARQGYSFAVYADEDVATDPFLRKAKVQIAPGHAEYWTDDMFYGLERYIEAGGRVFRSISGMEERVLRTGFGLKYEHAMPRAQINELVGAFTDGEGGFTAAPYRALCTEHWIFAGTGLKPGDLFGEDSANHPSFNIPDHQHYADMVDLKGQPTRGASGFFTSKTGRGSGQFSRLARGTNPQGGADMVYRPTASGGWIFNAGSLTFTGALFRDEAISRIVRNLLDEAISPVPLPRQEPRCL